MTKAQRRPGEAGIGAVTSGSGQTVKPAPVTPARGGTAVHRVVPAQLACRVGARAQVGEHDAWPAVVAIAPGSFALDHPGGAVCSLIQAIASVVQVAASPASRARPRPCGPWANTCTAWGTRSAASAEAKR